MTANIDFQIHEDNICVLTIDTPGTKANTLTAELISDLSDAVDRASAEESVKGILLVSGKESFIVGADLKNLDTKPRAEKVLTTEDEIERSLVLSRVLRRLETCGKPVAVVVNGAAAGGGCEVILACHYRVAADSPRVRIGLPEVTVGLIPGAGGTQRLPRLIGVEESLPLLQSGRLLSARDALRVGLVDEVVEGSRAVESAKAWLRQIGDPVQPWDKEGFEIPGGGPSEDARVTKLFQKANSATIAVTQGNLPAPMVVAAAVWEGLQLPFDTALRLEGKHFHRVFNHPTSRALIRTLFVSKREADRLVARPQQVEKQVVVSLGIVGAGATGASLALAAAQVGITVHLVDTTEERAGTGKLNAVDFLDRQVSRGRISREHRAEVAERINIHDAPSGLTGVDFVIEAVPESSGLKGIVHKDLEQWVQAEVPIALNASGLSITHLGSTLKSAQRFIGMRFFSPVERMPLVEIVRGRDTCATTFAGALDLAQQMRKTPVVVNDRGGFFMARFIGSFAREGVRMVEEGIDAALVENGARSLGMAQGPLREADRIGLDVGATLWRGVQDVVPAIATQPNISEVKDRLLYVQLAEGARAFAEGVLGSARDGDLGAVLGVGFPAYLGGPFVAMDELGISHVVEELDRLRKVHGPAFAAPTLLRQMASDGRTFYGGAAVEPPAPQYTRFY